MANRITAAAIVATLAFWAYTRTLLPGVDLGDTGGFQAAVLWPEVSARQAYPLYYALARPLVAAAGPDNPARALNLMSAIWAAVAVGLLVGLCASVTRSIAAGALAGLLLAFSYTFWAQAVIAEVYSLHLALVALCLLLLYAYAARPTTGRLLVAAGAYAVSFGNHLGMILLLVPFAVLVLLTTPEPRVLLRLSVIGTAALLAVLGALQYTPNFLAVWASLQGPEDWSDRVAAFWFDATKQDWRKAMVFGIDSSELRDRLAMFAVDARRQFGVAGLALAAVGLVHLWRAARPWAWLAITAYVVNAVFAITYNVGDAHVFFLPGHFFTALCAGAGVAGLLRWKGALRTLAPSHIGIIVLLFGYAGWRGWTTWPLADRHADRRGEQAIARLTAGLDDRTALLVSRLDWQLENVLLYTARYLRDDLAWVRLDDVMLHWPFLVDDAHRLGRDVVLTADAAADVLAAYGPSVQLVEDSPAAPASLIDAAVRIPRGTPYVLSILTPPPGYSLDPTLVDRALDTLTGGRMPPRMSRPYEVVAGTAGEAPHVHQSSARPFTVRFRLLDEAFTLHLDGWLPFETFRRPGFGHLLRGRERLLTVERGVSLVWLGREGRPSAPHYAAGLFAAEPRFRVPAATLQLALQAERPVQSARATPGRDWLEP